MKQRPFRKQPLAGRNALCPCGSGKKHKKCCLRKAQMFAALPPEIREQILINRMTGMDAQPINVPVQEPAIENPA